MLGLRERGGVMDKQFNLTFTATYFTLHTTINAETEEQAEANAIANLQDYYGIDLDQIKCQLEVEEVVL
jgi:hypothetical protein